MSAQTSEGRVDPLIKWVFGVIGTILAALLVGGWAANASDVRDATKRVAGLEANASGTERRLSGIDDRLNRIESKMDDIIRMLMERK